MEPDQFKLIFRIEQLPDGTFAGRCDYPKIEVKGATPQDVQQKLQHSMVSRFVQLLGIQLTTSFTGSGVELVATKTTPHATDAGTPEAGGPPSQGSSSSSPVFSSTVSSRHVFSTDPAAASSGTGPITAEPIDAGSFRAQKLVAILLGLAIVLGTLYWFFQG